MTNTTAGQGLAGAGGIFGFFGELIQGAEKQAAGEYNAYVDEVNAVQAHNEGLVALRKQQRQAAQMIGTAEAQYGISGVDSGQGSALQQLQNSKEQANLDELYLKQSYAAKEYGYKLSANLSRYEGDEARKSSYYSASANLLTSAGKAVAMGG